MSRWFRFYSDAMSNPKVATLTDADFRLWVKMLSVAAENDGDIPHVEALAAVIKMRLDYLSRGVERLLKARLIDLKGPFNGPLNTPLRPHSWDKFQYKSDTSTPRVTLHRAKRETAPETEADTEQKEDTVASATDGTPSPDEPVDLKAMLFSSGVPYLVRNGTKDANARAMLGKWRKQYGDGAVIDAISAAQSECASAPIPMITKILEARNGRTNRPDRDTEPSNPMVIEFARMAGHIPPDGRATSGNGRCDATGSPPSAREHSRPAQLALSSIKHH